MKNVNEESKNLLKAVAKTIVRREAMGWPPGCSGFAYQPKRPERVKLEKKQN